MSRMMKIHKTYRVTMTEVSETEYTIDIQAENEEAVEELLDTLIEMDTTWNPDDPRRSKYEARLEHQGGIVTHEINSIDIL